MGNAESIQQSEDKHKHQSDKYCFLPDDKEGFKIVEILERNVEKSQLIVRDLGQSSAPSKTVPLTDAIPVGSLDEIEDPPSDLIKLDFVHGAAILQTLRSRFEKDFIYTSIGPILVALNPFKWIPGIYDEAVMQKYKNEEFNMSENPHVFAVSHEAYSDLYFGQNQSLIISGESGAGKTEATKQCLNYLAFSAGSTSGIQAKILKASPILEAWGNAKTLRNNNSSRFGKFIEIWFDDNNIIVGSSNTTYILEKSRVVFQEKDERNYHVFYQLLKGASPDVLAEFRLTELAKQPELVNYINQSGCITIDDVDDAADFEEMSSSFADIGFAAEDTHALYRVIAAILHLGNVIFEEHPTNSEESVIATTGEENLQHSITLCGVEESVLRKALLFKMIKSGGGRRQSIAWATLLPSAAMDNKNALVKEIYNRCFDWIVAKINLLMGFDPSTAKRMIGILDIFGFEIFQKNSFEQLCINLANEALQQHFNFNIFQAEMDTYSAEDVPVPQLDFKDNQDVLDLIIKKPKGLIPMLDEEGVVPRGSWEGFLSKFSKQHASHARFKNRTKTNELGIIHYAGEVTYDPSLFLIKNKDTLSQDLVEVFAQSSVPLIAELFTADNTDALLAESASKRGSMVSSSGGSSKGGAANKFTVGKKFSTQLESLITKLNSTKPRYIRCVKPNQVKKPNIFVPDLTNEQLTYSGVFEAVVIMKNGYPYRLSHELFREHYHILVHGPMKMYHSLVWNQEMFKKYLEIVKDPTILDESAALTAIDSMGPQKPTKGKLHPFSRDQCHLLVSAIAASTHRKDFLKCFVGKTRTFYQAPQHRLLQMTRAQYSNIALLRIQSRARGYICRVMVSLLNRLEHDLIKAMQQREVDRIKLLGEEIKVLIGRFNKVYHTHTTHNTNISSNSSSSSKELFSRPSPRLALDYSTIVAQEMKLTEEIGTLLGKEDVDMMQKYDQLFDLLVKVQALEFRETFRKNTISLFWEENSTLLKYSVVIEKMGELVTLKRKFQQGIAMNDELTLGECVYKLAKLRETGDCTIEFCAAEEAEAKKIIKATEELLKSFLVTVKAALSVGRISLSRVIVDGSTGVSELKVVVDSESLKGLVAESTKPVADGGKELQKKSMKIAKIILMLEKLRDLRQSCSDGHWEQVWQCVEEDWKFLIAGSDILHNTGTADTIEAAAACSSSSRTSTSAPNTRRTSIAMKAAAAAEAEKNLYVPIEFHAELSAEMKDICIAAVTCFLQPRVQEALSRNGVPDAPTFGVAPDLNFEELENELKLAQSYEANFDEHLKNFMLQVQDNMALRRAAVTGDVGKMSSVLEACVNVSRKHSDCVNTQKYIAMKNATDNLYSSLLNGGIFGEIGYVDFSAFNLDGLDRTLDEIEKMNVRGKEWTDLLFIGKTVQMLRRQLFNGEFVEALAQMASLSTSEQWEKVNAKFLQFLTPELKTLMVTVQDEIRRYEVEVQHITALSRIVSAYAEGRITGDVSDPDISHCSVDKLATAIEETKAMVVQTADQYLALMRDCSGILTLRPLVLKADWVAIEDCIVQLQAATSGFSICHEQFADEFRLILDMLFEHKISTAIVEAISRGGLVVDPDTHLFNEIDVEESKSLISTFKMVEENLSTGFRLSAPTSKILFYAKGIYCMRLLASKNAWEPERLFFYGSAPSNTLPSLITPISTDPTLAVEREAAVSIIESLVAEKEQALFDNQKTKLLLQALAHSELTIAEIFSCVTEEVMSDKGLVMGSSSSSSNNNGISRYSRQQEQEQEMHMSRSVARNNIHDKTDTITIPDAGIGTTPGTTEVPSFVEEELNQVRLALVDRRCKAVLLLAAAIGCTTGNIEHLETSEQGTGPLSAAIEFTQQHINHCGDTTKNWLVAAKLLLRTRHFLLDNLAVINSTETSSTAVQQELMESLSPSDIQSCMQATIEGFPSAEFTLILNKLQDMTCISEIINAISFGGPVFKDGKFDVSQVQHRHIFERLESGRKLPVRSDKLDRLFFYTDMCINMRTAIVRDSWDLSTRGEVKKNKQRQDSVRRGSTFAKSVTVKFVMDEYQQAKKFFSSKIPGVPPQHLVDELLLIDREWQRRLMMQSFSAAFKSGRIEGSPLLLSLGELNTNLLEREIAAVQDHETRTGEVDNTVQIFVLAAKEIIGLRREALRLHQNYLKPCFFPVATNSLRTIIEDPTFIPQGISAAIRSVEKLVEPPYPIIEEWSTMVNMIADLKACNEIPFPREEIDLLTAETSERIYIAQEMSHFRFVEDILLGDSTEALHNLITSLIEEHEAYSERKQKEYLKAREKSVLGGFGRRTIIQRSPILDFIQDSAVVLVHLARARLEKLYDAPLREWKDDINFVNTPRMPALHQHITDGKFSVQQILRSTMKLNLHSIILRQLTMATQEVENAVSIAEMEAAFLNAEHQSKGDINAVQVQAHAITYMLSCNERVYTIGKFSTEVEVLHVTFEMMLSLRQAVHNTDYEKAISVIGQFLIGESQVDSRTSAAASSFGAILKIVHNQSYVDKVHHTAQREFELLALITCDVIWQQRSHHAMVRGYVDGRRGALLAHTISYEEIDIILQQYDVMKQRSESCMPWKRLCESVKAMRMSVVAIAGDTSANADPFRHSESSTIKTIDGADESELAAVVGIFTCESVCAAVNKIDALCGLNVSWPSPDAIANTLTAVLGLEKILQSPVAVRQRADSSTNDEGDHDSQMNVSSDEFYEAALIVNLSAEVALVKEHCRFIENCGNLEVIVNGGTETHSSSTLSVQQQKLHNEKLHRAQQHLLINFDEDGLDIPLKWYRIISERLHPRMTGDGFCDFDADLPQEYWWASLALAAKQFMMLMTSVAAVLELPADLLSSSSTASTSTRDDHHDDNNSTSPLLPPPQQQAAKMKPKDMVLHPGTKQFQHVVPLIHAVLSLESDLKHTLRENRGYRKKFVLPLVLTSAWSSLRAALEEHTVVLQLDRLVTADRVVTFKDEVGRFFIGVYHMTSVAMSDYTANYAGTDKDDVSGDGDPAAATTAAAACDHRPAANTPPRLSRLSMKRRDDKKGSGAGGDGDETVASSEGLESKNAFIAYGKQKLAEVRSLKLKTTLGDRLLQLLARLLEFRVAVSQEDFYGAQQLSSLIQWVDEFSNRTNDLEKFAEFMDVFSNCRQLEQAIVSCVLPSRIAWSLGKKHGYEVADAIQTRHLRKTLSAHKADHMNLNRDFRGVSELFLIATCLFDLVGAMQKGVWVNAKDRSIVAGSATAPAAEAGPCEGKFQDVIQAAVSMDCDITTFDNIVPHKQLNPLSPRAGSASLGAPKSVFAFYQQFRELIESSKCLSEYLLQYVKSVCVNVEHELKAVQYHALARKVLHDNCIRGSPGELIFSSNALVELPRQLDSIEADPELLNRCEIVNCFYQTCKVVILAIKAHVQGDLVALCKAIDMMVYLASLSPEKELGPNDFAVCSLYDTEDLLKLNEESFKRMFNFSSLRIGTSEEEEENITTIATARNGGVGAAHTMMAITTSDQRHGGAAANHHHPASASAASVDDGGGVSSLVGGVAHGKQLEFLDEYSRNKGYLSKTFKNTMNMSIVDAVYLHEGALEMIKLLKLHYKFECEFKEFQIALNKTPASGYPGELETDRINCSILSKIAKTLVDNETSSVGYGKLLHEAADTLLLLRSGQMTDDENVISEAMRRATALSSEEKSYTGPENVSHFGGTAKRFIALASKEIELAELDMQQRDIIRLMRMGLVSPGIPMTDYPFDVTQISTQLLQDALSLCADIQPTCAQAVKMFSATKIILTIRKLVKLNDWLTLKEYFDELQDTDTTEIFEDQSAIEFYNANKIRAVSQAVELATKAYSQGHLTGVPGTVPEGPDGPSIDADGLRHALEAFREVQDLWITPQLSEHINSCEILLELRASCLEEDWDRMHTCGEAAMAMRGNEKPIFDPCFTEIQLGYEHASFMVCCLALFSAIATGNLEGSIGNVDTSSIQLFALIKQYKKSKAIGYNNLYVQQLEESVVYLHRLRKAVLFGHWFKEDRTREYCRSLDHNFVVEEVLLPDEDLVFPVQFNAGASLGASLTFSHALFRGTSDEIGASMRKESGGGDDGHSDGDVDADNRNAADDQEWGGGSGGSSIAKTLFAQVDDDITNAITDEGKGEEQEKETDKVDKMAISGGAAASSSSSASSSPLSQEGAPLPDRAAVDNHFTVEEVLAQGTELRAKSIIGDEVAAEVDFVSQELMYRKIVSDLIADLHSLGIVGIPGAIDTSNVALRMLEKSINFAKQHPELSSRGVCHWLLRDAQLLLDARRYRVGNDWANLEATIAAADDQQNESGRAIVECVWSEINLLKADSLFHDCLADFATEVHAWQDDTAAAEDGTGTSTTAKLVAATESKDEAEKKAQGGSVGVIGEGEGEGERERPKNNRDLLGSDQGIERMAEILKRTKSASMFLPSPEFSRLIEAIAASLALREFCREEPNKSPQEIITMIAQTKKQNKLDNVPCYMALVIYDISKLSNILDFPANLAICEREIVSGQKYMEKEVGQIDLNDIDIRVLTSAYNAAVPSLEIMGSEENHFVMKLAKAVIDMRTALMSGDLRMVMSVVIHNEQVMKSPLVAEEVLRLRIETENYDTTKLIEYGLKNGRYIDVVSIAKMVGKHDRQFYHCASYYETVKTRTPFGMNAATTTAATAASTSAGEDDEDDEDDDVMDEQREAMLARANIHHQNNKYNQKYISSLLNSINALKRAVAVGRQVRVKSKATQRVLDAAITILQLRECIVAGSWNEVRRMVSNHIDDLPQAALEEVNAVREGLVYQHAIINLCKEFSAGAIRGQPHNVDVSHVDCVELHSALAVCDEQNFTDLSANIMVEAGRRLLALRQAVTTSCEIEEVPSYDPAINGGGSGGGRSGVGVGDYPRTPLETASTNGHHSSGIGGGGGGGSDAIAAAMHLRVKTLHSPEHIQKIIHDFLEFFDKYAPQLKGLLFQSSITEDTSSNSSNNNNNKIAAPKSRTSSSHRSSSVVSNAAEPAIDTHRSSSTFDEAEHDWIKEQWDGLNDVVGEVQLVQGLIDYNRVTGAMEAALTTLPGCVIKYLKETPVLDTEGRALAIGSLVSSSNLATAGSTGKKGTSSMSSNERDDPFYIQNIQSIIEKTEGYLQESMQQKSQQDSSSSSSTATSSAEKKKEWKEKEELMSSAEAELLQPLEMIYSLKVLRFVCRFRCILIEQKDVAAQVALAAEIERALAPGGSLHSISGHHHHHHPPPQQQQQQEGYDNGHGNSSYIRQERYLVELYAYLHAVRTFVPIKEGIVQALAVNRVRGCLDKLDVEDVQYEKLEKWIQAASHFLVAGEHLAIGLNVIVEQASVICNLRRSLKVHQNILLTDSTLKGSEAKLHLWEYAKEEFVHVQRARSFKAFELAVSQALAGFDLMKDTGGILRCLSVDVDMFEKCFVDLALIMTYESPLLLPLSGRRGGNGIGYGNASSSNSTTDINPYYNTNSNSNSIGRSAIMSPLKQHLQHKSAAAATAMDAHPDEQYKYVLSKEYFDTPNFTSAFSLWKLLRAVLKNRWHSKKKIHNNPTQPVAKNIDQFLYLFFGLGDSDYADNVDNVIDNRQSFMRTVRNTLALDGLIDSEGDQKVETVFSVLVSTDWTKFPRRVKTCFEQTRNMLIDQYCKNDLIYFCNAGRTTLDAAGNIMISELYLNFLQLAIRDADKAATLSSRVYLALPFQWSNDTRQWLSDARILSRCRDALMKQNMGVLIEELQANGFLFDYRMPSLTVRNIEDELEIFELYARGYLGETTLKSAVEDISALAAAEDGFSDAGQLLHSAGMDMLMELNATAVLISRPTSYHVSVIELAAALRYAIDSTLHCNLEGLLVGLRTIEEFYAHPRSPVLQGMRSQICVICEHLVAASSFNSVANTDAAVKNLAFVSKTFIEAELERRRAEEGSLMHEEHAMHITHHLKEAHLGSIVKALEDLGATCSDPVNIHSVTRHPLRQTNVVVPEIDDLRPRSGKLDAPFFCYRKINGLYAKINDHFKVSLPMWTLSVAITLHHMRLDLAAQLEMAGDESTIASMSVSTRTGKSSGPSKMKSVKNVTPFFAATYEGRQAALLQRIDRMELTGMLALRPALFSFLADLRSSSRRVNQTTSAANQDCSLMVVSKELSVLIHRESLLSKENLDSCVFRVSDIKALIGEIEDLARNCHDSEDFSIGATRRTLKQLSLLKALFERQDKVLAFNC